MKASVRGSILRPVIKRVEPPLPEWKARAIEMGHAQAQRAAATARAKKLSVQKPAAEVRAAVTFNSLVGLMLALAWP